MNRLCAVCPNDLIHLREWEECLSRLAQPTGLPQDDDLDARNAIRARCLADIRRLIKQLTS